MKSLLLLLFALAWLLVSSTAVVACQCYEYDVPVCSAFWTSQAVFVGQLQDITPPDPQSTNSHHATLHFIVEQPFRGVTTDTINIETLYGTTCDIKFAEGKRYLVYAYGDAKASKLFTGFCTRTSELADASDDLDYIRSVMQRSATESIAGRLLRMRYEPISGVKVEVRNENKTFEATSDEKGDFSVSVDGPGTYTIKVIVPSSVTLMSFHEEPTEEIKTTDALTTIKYKVKLDKSECHYRQFNVFPVDLHATAVISGNVLTGSGRAVDRGYVYLVDAADSESSKDTKIEKDGTFKFEYIAAGEYFLVLNPRDQAPGENDPPYRRTYYPSATNASGATKIVVTEDTKLDNLILRVGPAWKARTISGKVVWKDGGQVTNAHISLYDGDRYVRQVEVDVNGRFNFKGYGDFNYTIQAHVYGKRSGKSDRVAVTDKSTNLTLVLKPE